MPTVQADVWSRADTEQASVPANEKGLAESSKSAGVTVGATIGGVLLVAVGMAAVFVLVRRRNRNRAGASGEQKRKSNLKRSDTIMSFRSRGDDEEHADAEALLEKSGANSKHHHFRSESNAPLLAHEHRRTDSDSSTGSRPSVPRLAVEIPPSPGLPASTAFRATMPPDSGLLSSSYDHFQEHDVSSACMSSASPNSAHAAFALSAFAGPRAATPEIASMPIRTVAAVRTAVAARTGVLREGLAPTSAVSADDADADHTPDAKRHQSLYPIAIQNLPGGPPTSALMELPSPFVFKSSDNALSPLSPAISPLPSPDSRTLDAAQLSEVIAAANWEWDAPSARATIALREAGSLPPSSGSRQASTVQPLQVRGPRAPAPWKGRKPSVTSF